MTEEPRVPLLQDAPRLMTRFERVSVGAYLVAFALLLIAIFISLWPKEVGKISQTGNESVLPILEPIPIDIRIVLLVLIAGALGGALHALRSYTAYAGNRELISSWTFWYFVRPLEGAIFAIVFYLLIRGGLMPGGVTGSNVSIVGFTGAAMLIGLFSDLAAIKLKEVFTTMFSATTPDERRDKLGSSGQGAKPEIHSVTPEQLSMDTQSLTISLAGKNFVAGTKVTVDGEERPSKLETDGRLTVTLESKDVATKGGRQIVATNPPPAGGTSEPSGLIIK